MGTKGWNVCEIPILVNVSFDVQQIIETITKGGASSFLFPLLAIYGLIDQKQQHVWQKLQ